jgi:hypothetical protein
MKIVFTDSFFESLERMRRHQTWWYKTYEFFRYNLPYFFRNIWSFRRELYRFRSWDYQFNQDLFSRSLELAADGMEKYGREVDETRLKKVAMMRRAAALLRNREDEIYEIVDKEMGPLNLDYMFEREDTPEEAAHKRKYYDRVKEIFAAEREELWTILKGTGIIDDGTDIRGWWRS